MRKNACIFTVLVVLLALLPTYSQVEATEQNEKDYLIEVKSEVDMQLIEKAGGKVKEKYKKAKVAKAKLSETELKKLKKEPKISLIEEDAQVESYPLSGNTFIEEGYSWGAKRINAKASHENGETGKGIKVAILDTGISQNAQLTIQKEASFINAEPNTEDENGHGTTVASLIASRYEKTGLKGIAPDVELYSAKVLDKDGVGKYSDIIEGLEWALEEDVNIVNMSFGGTNNSEILENVINKANKAGVLLISSVGNNGEETVTYPAAYESVIGVGASNYYNNKTAFTNIGKGLELLAPGVNLSTVDQNGKLVTISGTSAASSYVSGAAALIWSQNIHLDNEHIRSILNEYSTKLNNNAEYGLISLNPNVSQHVYNDGQNLTNEEVLYLREAGWSQEALSETPTNLLKEFINEGAMNPDYSESTYRFKLPDEANGDVQSQNLNNGGEITLGVSASYVGVVNGYKQFKITGSFNWNQMPVNRYTDLFALAWTDNAWFNSTTKLAHTWYGAIPITDYISVYNPVLKAGMSWKVNMHAGSSDEKGSFTQYVYLPKTVTSASNGPFQTKVEYSHAFTTVSPSIGGGSSGFSYGIVPGISTDYADNPPISSVKSY